MAAPDFHWESRVHFLEWARFLDPDYDPDLSAEPRFFIAWTVARVNPFTAACALVNADGRRDLKEPEKLIFDRVETWVKRMIEAQPNIGQFDFEARATEFLKRVDK